MSEQCEVSENTSLSRPIHNNNNIKNNSSGCDNNSSAVNMELDNTRCIISKLILDIAILFCVGLPILFLFVWGEPYERGFFCDDESLMHPFLESTIKNWVMYIIGFILPIGVIITTEIINARNNTQYSNKKWRIFNHDIPAWVVASYMQIGVFGFGAACSQLTVDVAKYSIGRLRPHFFDVCGPLMSDGTNCQNPINVGKYIVDFTCMNTNSSDRALKEMRLSFPSGHSSFSAYTMIYLGIYLHMRMTWKGSKLMKNFFQFILFLMAWYTAMSRISNYKHHWSDVLTGSTIGVLIALIVANFVSDLFKIKENTSLPLRNEHGTTLNGV